MFLATAGAAYAVTLVSFFLAYWPGKWPSGPNLEDLRGRIGRGEDYARYWSADSYVLGIEVTGGVVTKKRNYLIACIAAFSAETILLAATAVSTFIR